MRHPHPLAAILARCRSGLLLAAALSLLINLLALSMTFYTSQLFDRVLTSRSIDTLLYLTMIVLGAFTLLGGFELLRQRALLRISLWMERRVGVLILQRGLEPAAGSRANAAEALRDAALLRGALAGPAVLALFDVPWAPVYVAASYLLHPLLGHIVLGGSVLLVGLALATELTTRHASDAATAATLQAQRGVDQACRAVEVIDGMGLLPAVQMRWSAHADQAAALQLAAGDNASVLHAISKAVRMALQAVTFAAGAWLVINGEVTSGMMTAASMIASRALAPVEQAIGAWKQTQSTRAAWCRLRAALSAPKLRPEAMVLPEPPVARLEVEALAYLPPGATRPVLSGISFAVEPGEAVAVIGPSAAGKSTLARLLVGCLVPSAGCVRLGGADVFAQDRASFARYVGYVPQRGELMDGTVRENIARMQHDADPRAVVEAARLAGAHGMVLRLPGGYETQIGPGSNRLSGGQVQRVALARALYGRPRLVVLDEPNANLDADGEAALAAAIAALKRAGAAVVVIGHRPGTLNQADKVLVLRDGRLEAFGPRAAVLARITRPVPAAARVAAGE